MKKKPVLVIADKHFQGFYCTLFIKDEEINVILPKDSLNVLQQIGADIVLLDSGFDAQNGLSLLKEIKSVRKDVPVIFLTSASSEEIAIKAMKLGVRDYYRHPVSIIKLRREVESILKIKRTPHENREPLSISVNGNGAGVTDSIHSEIPPNIVRTVLFIEDNIASNHTLDDLANVANLSKYHFSRLFKNLTGISPIEFVKVIRIHKSKELLSRRNMSVSMVAEEVGFTDLSNFERHFKRVTGVAPRTFRKMLDQ